MINYLRHVHKVERGVVINNLKGGWS
jgi:hypothetical protein